MLIVVLHNFHGIKGNPEEAMPGWKPSTKRKLPRFRETPVAEGRIMRIAILLSLTFLLLASPAVSLTPDDNLIVPGVRIGKWTLKMTIDDLLRMNGPSSPALWTPGNEEGLSDKQNSWFYGWAAIALGAKTFDRKKVEVLVAGIMGGVVPFQTDKGITLLQSKRSDILKVYGKPTAMVKATYGQSELLYDKIGLGFRVYDEGGGIRDIYVFRPGMAKSLWTF